MTDAVAIALISSLTTIGGSIFSVIIAKINKVQKTVNGRLSEALARIERAEKISPGITMIPEHMETRAVLTINDPSNNDPPKTKITETKISENNPLFQSKGFRI